MKNLSFLFFFFLLAAGQLFSQSRVTDCTDAQAIKQYFEDNGFQAKPVTITGKSQSVASALVHDHAQLTILLEGKTVNLAETLQKDVKAGASEGFATAAFITKNENFCDAALSVIIYDDFKKGQYDSSVNAHIWDNPDGPDDLLFLRVNPIELEKVRGK